MLAETRFDKKLPRNLFLYSGAQKTERNDQNEKGDGKWKKRLKKEREEKKEVEKEIKRVVDEDQNSIKRKFR